MTTSLYGSVGDPVNGNHAVDVAGNAADVSLSEYTPLKESHETTSNAQENHYKPICTDRVKCEADVDHSSLISRLIFLWFTPILHRGNEKKRLDSEDLDLIALPKSCQTREILDVFDKYWSELSTPTQQPSLFTALYRAFGADYIKAGCLKLLHDLCVFVGPQVLHSMILFLRTPSDTSMLHGLFLTLVVTVSQITMSLCLRHYFFKCYTTGLRVRTAVVVAVYRKALRLHASERQTKSLGEITNLMSIDAQRLQDLMNYFHALWYSPLQIGLALYFLWKQLGVSSLGGVAVILVMIPVTKYVAQWMAGMQRKLMQAKDRRVEMNSEVLGGMKVIKLQAWEEPYSTRILNLRAAELRQLFRYFMGSAFSRMLWTFTPLGVALATFSCYVYLGHELDVASALTSLALFEILRFPLFMLPRIVNSTVEAYVSLYRIQHFLLSPNYQDHLFIADDETTTEHESVIKIQNVSAAYDSNKTKLAALNADMKDTTKNDPILQELLEKNWEITLLQSQLQEAEYRIRELADKQSAAVKNNPTSLPSSASLSSLVNPENRSTANLSLLCLKRIDFDCQPGQLIAVVGGVGCGKSSLINAILGEVRLLAGATSVHCPSLAYFSQSPFILNASVRDNILFGHLIDEQINEARYERALDCCALRHDLELLPEGDATEIGEKGITLSGGQKARVALARAVYHHAELTLIDDALAAVDAHVAAHLFEHAIVNELMHDNENGGRKKRSVVLITNAIQYLKHRCVDKIVVMQDGRIVEQGTYLELAEKEDSVFSRFLNVINDTGVSAGGRKESDIDSLKLNDSAANSAVKEMEVNSKAEILDASAKKDEAAIVKKLMSDEARKTGHVGRDVYLAWCKAAGGFWVPLTLLFVFTISESLSVVSNWWLTYWSAHGSGSQVRFLAIYACINVSAVFVGLTRMLLLAFVGLSASRRLFQDMLAVILRAPMSFFDTTPVGRLLNRFSKDIYTIDEQLMDTLSTYLSTLFAVGSTIVVISGISPIFVVCLIPMILFYVHEQAFFTVSYRELKRLDSTNRSPIYALLGESVDGVAVIRSFRAEESLTRRLISMLDVQQHAYYLTCAAQSWLAVRLELIGTLIITFATLSAVFEHSAANGNEAVIGLAGLAISYSLSVTQALNWSVRMASDLEAAMVAVERVLEYSQVESEGDRHTAVDDTLGSNWPSDGKVDIVDAKLRYRMGLPLVLKGLNLHIPAGSKVGVVGRTGAGKSTLMVALLRIVELTEGQILIDDQDTSKVGLAKLRSKIAVIPQDPVLYSGSVRSNLDPFDDFADEQLYEVLERVGLHTMNSISSSTHSFLSQQQSRIESLLDSVSEGGSNFSVGQRQLLVIARALLHGSRVVIMDEATAAVDAETDAAIQKVMKLEFEKATVITVAHRINTIMDSDYILVMADGLAAEFDTPSNLLERGGHFRDLVQAASRE